MKFTLFHLFFVLVFAFPAFAQSDSVKTVELDDVTVVGNNYRALNSALTTEAVGKDFIRSRFTGNLMQTLEHIPGVRSMDIGSGFSKPMIRGMAFNRISVTENGIKQEGQQWGTDYGLEIDAFNIEQVIVHKGPLSLLYGSDAMGGVIEIKPYAAPVENSFLGEVVLLGKSVNGTLAASLMLALKKNAWHSKIRYSEKHYGDYSVPTDTIVYLTQKIPIYGRQLKNTAGFERDISFSTEYSKGKYYANYMLSNAYQKSGFFPGAHGIPDISQVQDDGSSRNIELPYNTVNHLKLSTRQQYIFSHLKTWWDIGYQHNHREEWSKFHTHYGTQLPPINDPDKELVFKLSTISSSIKAKTMLYKHWEHSAGWDIQYQQNHIAGYSFLLPEYNRFTTGVFWLSEWKPASKIAVSGGVRYDYGKINISAYADNYLENYLTEKGYDAETVEKYKHRSYAVNRNFGNFSGALGVVFHITHTKTLKTNLGHSFRLPGANELAANGVHHGTFRHEQGDPSLSPESGFQYDIAYTYNSKRFYLSVSPFISWYKNYIYLKPTGEWSVLPHAGQIYRYMGANVLFAGTELSFKINITEYLSYAFKADYVYTHNNDEHTPLSFSPPASMRNTLELNLNKYKLYVELHSIASQKRVSKNEQVTNGTSLLNIGGTINIPVYKTIIDVSVTANNLLNTKYYNHLSFYRKVEIPEPGRNIQLLIKVPFKHKIK